MRIESQPLRSSLTHVALPPRLGTRARPPLLVLVHGRGADEHDLIPVTHYLDPRFYILSVRAPYKFPYGGYTWYELIEEGKPDPEEFRESYTKLETLIADAMGHYPVSTGPIYMFGFSMGAMMSLSYTLMHPKRVRGLVAHSGYLPHEAEMDYRWGDLAGVSIFMAHGTQDPVVPVRLARKTQDLLKPTDASFIYKEYAIQHQVSEESITDINQWLENLLGPMPKS